MSMVKAHIYKCVGKDAAGQVVVRVDIVSNGPMHAARCADKWAKQFDKGYVTFNPLECKRQAGNNNLYLDWPE